MYIEISHANAVYEMKFAGMGYVVNPYTALETSDVQRRTSFQTGLYFSVPAT